MRKLLIIIITAIAGYLAYDYLIKEKQVLEINANKIISTAYSSDIEAPSIFPAYTGAIQGTIKNISDKVVKNILLRYKLDGKPVEASIYSLEPGIQISFSTPKVTVQSDDVRFYLVELTFDD